MRSMPIQEPFGPAVEEIPLPRAPLALVVAQVTYPLDLRIDNESFVASLHEALRNQYPVLRRSEEMRLEFGREGPKVMPAQAVWRMIEKDSGGWEVTASRNFTSLSTSQYTNRADFLARLRRVLEALQSWISPVYADRFGVRYVCRLSEDEHLRQLQLLLRREVSGALSIELGEATVSQRHQLVDALYQCGDATVLHARWGLLPPQATLDPGVTPLQERSFLLDIDVATEGSRGYSAGELHDLARTLCERQYRFFRWSVTDDFLRAFGGNP